VEREERWRAELDARIAAREDWSPAAWLDDLGDDDRVAVGEEARARLEEMPIPIGVHADHDPRRRTLARIVGWCEALAGGDTEAALEAERVVWLRGGDAMFYLQAMRRFGRSGMASLMARTVLIKEGTPEDERARLMAFFEDRATLPAGWDDAVEALLIDPSPERAEAIMAFVPEERYFERLRLLIETLEARGLDGDSLFRIATVGPTTSAAIGLVEDGYVSVEAVLERADQSTPTGRPLWVGLAARAAFRQGQLFRAIRLLREAFATAVHPFLPSQDRDWLWEESDESFREMLRRAGLAATED